MNRETGVNEWGQQECVNPSIKPSILQPSDTPPRPLPPAMRARSAADVEPVRQRPRPLLDDGRNTAQRPAIVLLLSSGNEVGAGVGHVDDVPCGTGERGRSVDVSSRRRGSLLLLAHPPPPPCTTTPHHNTTTPQDHNTTTPQHHDTTTLQHHFTTRPQDHKTTRPQDHKTTRPQDHTTATVETYMSWHCDVFASCASFLPAFVCCTRPSSRYILSKSRNLTRPR